VTGSIVNVTSTEIQRCERSAAYGTATVLRERRMESVLHGDARLQSCRHRHFRLAASRSSAHVFNDLSTLSRVESEIFSRGSYTGTVRGFERYGLRFDKPIGTRFARDGSAKALDYGELKLKDGLYHLNPRTEPSQ
jgi:hypothetical protein